MFPLVEQYDQQHLTYREFCARVESLIIQLLTANNIAVHSVHARVKARDSFTKKISGTGANYTNLSDITDIAGIRVITYFTGQVDEVSKLIESEFHVDAPNSSDKSTNLDPDRFGYLSVHYVASLAAERDDLMEYRAYKGLKAEIQIRSILQHAWAEIEHDLGYKASIEIPRNTRRQFARLAGLLEIADSEFMKIRNDLSLYEQDVSKQIAEAPNSVAVDRISLGDLINTDPVVKELDAGIAKTLNYSLAGEIDELGDIIEMLNYFNKTSIGDIKQSLITYRADVARLAGTFKQRNDDDGVDWGQETVARGISLFYLCQILAGATNDESSARTFFEKFKIGLYPEQDSAAAVEFMRER